MRMSNKELGLAFFEASPKKETENHRKCIEHFSKGTNTCNCCGEDQMGFLTLSHVNHDGWIHKRMLGGDHIIPRLVKDNFKTEYEIIVECYNCNLSRRYNGGKCPHEETSHGT